MRIIAQTPLNKLDKQTAILAEMMLNPKLYKQYPIFALLDCSLTDKQAKHLPLNVYNVWKDLYQLDRNGFLPPLDKIEPATFYFTIKSLIPEDLLDLMETNGGFNEDATNKQGGNKVNYPFNITPSQDVGQETLKDNALAPAPDKNAKQIEKAIKRSLIPRQNRNQDKFSNALTKFWDNEIAEKKDHTDKRLQEFSKLWRTKKALENVTSKIKEETLKENVRIEPYAKDLTDTGIILTAAGISGDVFPYYLNHAPDVKDHRRKIMAIFDLSPSMQPYLPYMAKIVEVLEEDCDVSFSLPTDPSKEGSGEETTRGAIGFSGDVINLSEQDLQDMKNGKFKMGQSTCFEELIRYMTEVVKSNNVDCCVVFSDGESGVAVETCAKFNETGKVMYRVYFGPETKDNQEVKSLSSPLDACSGESFTLRLPPADKI